MTINMNLGANSYDIIVERGTLNKANEYLNLNRKALVVTDSGVPSIYAQTVASLCKEAFIITIEQGENSKSFEVLQNLCSTMLKNNFSRKDCVVAVGGGVVGDLSGFAAASYMRGIDFYNIPTTVLSQVDSSIGGKVAINFEGVKNIIGAFYQPKCVLIDPDVLNTLSSRQISNGLAEAVKMGMTSDKDLFALFEDSDYLENIDDIIIRSLLIKRRIVEQDEKENGLRKILNFGHTVGHGFESISFGKLYHGECVALGMLYMCSNSVKERLIKVLEKLNLPTEIDFDIQNVIEAISHDKKSDKNSISVIVVNEIGTFEIQNKTISEIRELL